MPTPPGPSPSPDGSDLNLTKAAQIGAALPHLLGFHPEQSIICLWLKHRQLVVTQRADAPDGEQFSDYAGALFAPVRALDVDEVIVVCMAQEPAVPDGLVRGVAEQCPAPVRVHLHMPGTQIRECTPGHDQSDSWRWIGTKERQQAAACFTAPDCLVWRGRGSLSPRNCRIGHVIARSTPMITRGIKSHWTI